jgi:hypothetical protein
MQDARAGRHPLGGAVLDHPAAAMRILVLNAATSKQFATKSATISI